MSNIKIKVFINVNEKYILLYFEKNNSYKYS